MRVLDGFIPERRDWLALEDGDEDICHTPCHYKRDSPVTYAAEDRLDENSQVKAEKGNLGQADDDFVHDLGREEPLHGLVGPM